jgi:hypothetical protein
MTVPTHQKHFEESEATALPIRQESRLQLSCVFQGEVKTMVWYLLSESTLGTFMPASTIYEARSI